MDGKKLCGHRLRVEMSCDGNPQGARNFKCMCYLCKRHREEQSKSAVDQAESRWGLFLIVALKFGRVLIGGDRVEKRQITDQMSGHLQSLMPSLLFNPF